MDSKERKPKTATASQEGPVWSVNHMAHHCGVASSFYRANILTRDDHPVAINPSAGRWYWFRSQIEPWLTQQFGEQIAANDTSSEAELLGGAA